MNKKMRIDRLFIFLFVIMISVFIIACSEEKQTGVIGVKWDRDACERCQMMLSEHHFAAQIRVFPKEKRSKVYKFDDMGCAVLWLAKQSYQNDPKTEIWVNHYQTNEWLNAKNSWFIKQQSSPMNYGLGAQNKRITGALNYQQAVQHINDVEQKLNIHGGNLRH
jgi:nitrous oxide reductase accessory protein NosL